jgi:MFS family permease
LTSSRRNLAVLIASQALLFTNNSVFVSLTGLAGFSLAADKAFATLPITFYVAGGALASMPVAFAMKRYGRRAGFIGGALCAIAGSSLAALAIYLSLFWLFCIATTILGFYFAAGQQYRFAAAEAVPGDGRSRAISWVLAGGLVGGALGPETAKFTKDVFAQHVFMGGYLSLIVFALMAIAVLTRLDLPPLTAQEQAERGRPLAEIMRTPIFIVAALGAMVSYGVMNLLMTATPIAMTLCSHPFNDVAFVIQWHLIGMFAPAFFTGSLVKRFGTLPVIAAGIILMLGCVAIALSGVEVMQFWGALLLLGVGWNFMYVGATTLLTEAGRPAERAKIQGVNDFLVFGTMALTSVLSGALVAMTGWHDMNFWALPFLALVAISLVWLGILRRSPPRPA